jgi:hypothetical protein
MSETKLKRSSTYNRMFSDDKMLEAFGKLNPTLTERTAYFAECWIQWRPNKYMLIRGKSDRELRKILLDYGLQDLWDFQLKSGQIRFRSSDMAAISKLSIAKDYIKDV